MGCSIDAVTLAEIPHPGTASAGYYQVVELRYSEMCDASWAKVTSRLEKDDILFTRASVQGRWAATRVIGYGKRVVVSRMWPGRDNTACGVSVWRAEPSYRAVGCATEGD